MKMFNRDQNEALPCPSHAITYMIIFAPVLPTREIKMQSIKPSHFSVIRYIRLIDFNPVTSHHQSNSMQSVVVFVALVAAASANVIVRSPAHDSAVIKSDRLGGNWAYSVVENPAHNVVTPVVSQVTQPIATTYAVSVPTHTSTVVTGSSPVAAEVKSVPVTYGTGQPWAWSTQTIDASSPIVYSSKSNLVGVETEKQINQVVQAVQPAVTYTTVQQPASTIVSTGTPVSWSTVQQPIVASGTPVTYTTTTKVQQPANTIVTSGTPVSWATNAATTYAVQPASVTGVQTISGASPWVYGNGQPWAWNGATWNGAWNGAWNTQQVVV